MQAPRLAGVKHQQGAGACRCRCLMRAWVRVTSALGGSAVCGRAWVCGEMATMHELVLHHHPLSTVPSVVSLSKASSLRGEYASAERSGAEQRELQVPCMRAAGSRDVCCRLSLVSTLHATSCPFDRAHGWAAVMQGRSCREGYEVRGGTTAWTVRDGKWGSWTRTEKIADAWARRLQNRGRRCGGSSLDSSLARPQAVLHKAGGFVGGRAGPCSCLHTRSECADVQGQRTEYEELHIV